MKLIFLNWAKFAVCLWTGKNKVAQSAQKPVAEFLTEVYQLRYNQLLLWGEEKKEMLFCMRVFLRQSQCDRQCGDPGWADGDRICRFLQEGETSAQRGHGATRWGKKQLTVLMIKKEIMSAFQTPQQCKEADRSMLISRGCFIVLVNVDLNELGKFSCYLSGPRMNGQSRLERHLAGYESSSTMMSSELETTSFCDSEDDDTMSRWQSLKSSRLAVVKISGTIRK